MCLQTSELGVTEHVEGDPCKFALWVGRTPSSDNKTVLKVHYVLSLLLLILLFSIFSICKHVPISEKSILINQGPTFQTWIFCLNCA